MKEARIEEDPFSCVTLIRGLKRTKRECRKLEHLEYYNNRSHFYIEKVKSKRKARS